MQNSLPRLAVDIAALLNSVIWAISGIILVSVWTANPQLLGFHGLILLYLPTSFIWTAGLALFLNAIDARLPTKYLILLGVAWVIGILWPLLGIPRDLSDYSHLAFVLFHLLIIGWLPIIVLVLILRFYFRIHVAMMIWIPIAWILGGIVATLLLYESFLAVNQFVSLALVSFGYGIMGLMSGGVTLFAVKQAKLR